MAGEADAELLEPSARPGYPSVPGSRHRQAGVAPGHRRRLGSPVSPTVSLALAEAVSVPAVCSAKGAEGFFSSILLIS